MNFFRFSTFFWAINFENSFLENVVRMEQFFLGFESVVYIPSKPDMNKKILAMVMSALVAAGKNLSVKDVPMEVG